MKKWLPLLSLVRTYLIKTSKMKKVLFSLLLSFLPSLVFAHNGNNGFVTVTNFQLWSNTYNAPEIRVIISGDTYYNPSNCPNPDSYMVTTALTEKIQDRMYSALLSAALAKKSIVLRVENNGCQNGRPAIMNVIIE